MTRKNRLAESADFAIKRINRDSDAEMSVSLRDVLNLVFKRKILIVVVFCMVVAGIGFVTLRKTPTFRATAKILVKIERENINTPAKATRLPGEMQINSEIEILNSRSLAEETLKALGPEVIYAKPDTQKQDPLTNIRSETQRCCQ